MKKLNNVYEAPKAELVELFAEGEIMSSVTSGSIVNNSI